MVATCVKSPQCIEACGPDGRCSYGVQEVLTKIDQVATPAQPSPLDVQIGGEHYKSKAIQPIEYILANDLGFVEGNIVKYVTRWRDKGGIEDLKKVAHYIELFIKHHEGKL